jgi:murein DD-endopeptidase MepM/ murein hydrolase activator NlpD
MILCPLQNQGILKRYWVQKRPFVTQKFGLNPDVYSQFGMDGHNGVDFRAKLTTPVFSPIDGKVKTKKSEHGYGWHLKIRGGEREIVLGHLSGFLVKDGQYVRMGDKIGITGNTGFSTAPHLHFGLRRLKKGKGDIFKWDVKAYNNGFYGYEDVEMYMITWKGTLYFKNL